MGLNDNAVHMQTIFFNVLKCLMYMIDVHTNMSNVSFPG